MENIKYTISEYNNAKCMDKLKVSCSYCNNILLRTKKDITRALKDKQKNIFCNNQCRGNYFNTEKIYQCVECGTNILRRNNDIKKSKKLFCNHSCHAIYTNKNKTTGIRRSKLEIWLESKLNLIYPNLFILYCDKTTIKSELDIYIPSLKFAIELNGIFHYEPIYGKDKLKTIQNNDNRKFQACLENNIELMIIDTSSMKYFKEQNCQKYLDIITTIINYKLNLANI